MSAIGAAADRRAEPRRFGRRLAGYWFLLPWLIGFVGLTMGPTLASLVMSFTDYNLMGPPKAIGLANYERMLFGDARFWTSMQVTFTYVLLAVPLKLSFALALAMLLNRHFAGVSVYRAIFYLPSLLGGSVAISLVWRQVFSKEGLLNQFLALFGYDGPAWISTPDTALYTLVLLAAWQFGSPMIIFIAGLRQIPRDLYESAALDGATPSQRFFRITLPMLTPVIFFNLVVQTIDAFKAFTPAYIISDGSGGPINSTLFYTLYLYREAFVNFRVGYASALAWWLVIIIATLTALSFLSSRYWVHYDD